MLALTDHDTTAGLAEAREQAGHLGIHFVNGIELSTTWQDKSLHIVGLGIDPESPRLLEATSKLEQIRNQRAEKIAEKLEKKQMPGALTWVKQKAGGSMITRTHFADFLVTHFYVNTPQEAFDKYLIRGKPAYVTTQWLDMAEAVELINQAGGVAVLAHPMRYKLTASWMRRLLTGFKEVGGKAMEVVTGRSNPEEIKVLADYAKQFALAGSVGSDFHHPNNQWVELGRLAPLPGNVQPVWELLQ